MSSDLHPVFDSEEYKSLARSHAELAARVYGTGGLEEKVKILEEKLSLVVADGEGRLHLQNKELL